MSTKPSRDNHIVTVGYLRYFADADDRVRLVELNGEIGKCLPLRAVMKETDFSVIRLPDGFDDQVEEGWATIENRALPHLRGIGLGYDLTDEQDIAIKALVALHFARAYGAKQLFDETWDRHMGAFVQRSADDQCLIQAFIEDYKREPVEGEIKRLTTQHVDDERNTNLPWVKTQLEYYEKMLEKLVPLRIERGIIAGGKAHFLTSDSPFVLQRDDEVGRTGQIPFEQADSFFMPMTKNCVVAFTTRPERPSVTVLNPEGVRQINTPVCRAADRFVVAWPRATESISAPWLPARP
jgi:hypothetical protein